MFTDFEYANKLLSDFDCIVGHFNTDAGIEESDIGCDITFTTVKNKHSSVYSVTSSSYENVYTKTFEILKNPCKKQNDEMYFTSQEASAIIRWLNRREYHKFKWTNSNLYHMGSFNVRENRMNQKIFSFTLTFTGNTPYALEDDVLMEFVTTVPDEVISVFGTGDEYGVIYPQVRIKCLAGGNLTLTNLTTENTVMIKGCSSNETICLDGEHRIIITDNISHSNTLYNDFNYEFVELLIDDSNFCENIYKISLPCEISIAYAPIRKTGV